MAATALAETAHTITLPCWECDGTFTMRRRRGQYPRRCPACQHTVLRRQHAERLADKARRLGFTARALNHVRRGWTCWVLVQGRDRPVLLHDDLDLEYLATELTHGYDAPVYVNPTALVP